jgi:hypothetical protein
MNNHLTLTRFNYGPEGTFSKLLFPTGEQFFTVEKPWRSNTAFFSCIPDGLYYLGKRDSPVVSRTTGGEFTEGWEVLDVPGREYIMIHPGNWPADLQGCIAPGTDYRITRNKQGIHIPSVMNSRVAFREIMELMDRYNDWVLDIRPFMMSYP